MDNIQVEAQNQIQNLSEELEVTQKLYRNCLHTLGRMHPDTLTALNRLGILYNAQGKHTKAFDTFQKVFMLRCKVLGQEHPDTLDTMVLIAYTHNAIGKPHRAFAWAQRAYDMQYQVLGEDHIKTRQTLNFINSLPDVRPL